jgi:hypothetical protein
VNLRTCDSKDCDKIIEMAFSTGSDYWLCEDCTLLDLDINQKELWDEVCKVETKIKLWLAGADTAPNESTTTT